MALKLALLASGRGSNAATIVRHAKAGTLDAEIALVLCNNPEAQVLKTMAEEGIPTWCRSHKDFPDRLSFDRAMLEAMGEAGVDTVALCGYMRLLSGEFIASYPGRILNVHPAILPSFPGTQGGRDAYEYGVRFTGCTVHFVIEEMDAGAIIIQGVTSVLSAESEVDFVVQKNGKIIPIEVKSGENVKAKSLRVYRDKYEPELAVRFSMKPLENNQDLLNIPLYYSWLFDQLLESTDIPPENV